MDRGGGKSRSGIMSLRESAYKFPNISGGRAMRGSTIMILAVAVLGFYLVDNFQYDGYYRNLVWTQSNAEVQKLQDQLTEWWHGR